MTQETDARITLESNSSFLYSFFFLPPEKRQAIYTLYAFCRQTDDIADDIGPVEKKIGVLNSWEKELRRCFLHKVSNYFDSVQQVAEGFKIPFEYFQELINGVRMDLNHLDYRNFEDLKIYCYRVASVVGLMCIQIFGYRDPVIKEYAENLGIALQLTNIIRDVGTDAKLGRIYIPEEDLKRFGVKRSHIMTGEETKEFQDLMAFQADRAYGYYDKAQGCLPDHELRNMLVSEIMKDIYFSLLNKIVARKFSVLSDKIRLNNPTKVCIALRTVTKIKLLGKPISQAPAL